MNAFTLEARGSLCCVRYSMGLPIMGKCESRAVGRSKSLLRSFGLESIAHVTAMSGDVTSYVRVRVDRCCCFGDARWFGCSTFKLWQGRAQVGAHGFVLADRCRRQSPIKCREAAGADD